MKDKKQGELVFLDEFRSQREQEQMEWSKIIPQEAYLTTSDLETLTMPEISWIIRHLMSRSDFEWRKEEAEKMINEILDDREKEDT